MLIVRCRFAGCGFGPSFSCAQENVAYFNRLLNLIHLHAPQAKISLVMSPNDLVAALERELGVTAKGEPVLPPKQQQQPAAAHAPPPGADQPVEEVPLPASGPRVLGFGRVAHINVRARNAMRAAGYRGEGLVLPLDKSDEENDAALREALQKEEYDAVAIGGGVTMLSPLVERTQVHEPAEGSCSARAHDVSARAPLLISLFPPSLCLAFPFLCSCVSAGGHGCVQPPAEPGAPGRPAREDRAGAGCACVIRPGGRAAPCGGPAAEGVSQRPQLSSPAAACALALQSRARPHSSGTASVLACFFLLLLLISPSPTPHLSPRMRPAPSAAVSVSVHSASRLALIRTSRAVPIGMCAPQF